MFVVVFYDPLHFYNISCNVSSFIYNFESFFIVYLEICQTFFILKKNHPRSEFHEYFLLFFYYLFHLSPPSSLFLLLTLDLVYSFSISLRCTISLFV